MNLYRLLRPALFALDAEHSHELAIAALSRGGALAGVVFGQRLPPDPFELAGLRLPNRVGLAAGLDKSAECVDALAALGFGFIETGTVTPRPQPGNPRPRLFRLPRHRALINRMGFNNKGVDHAVRMLARRRCTVPVGLNIGKNADTPLERAGDDYELCLRRAWEVADWFTVNLSSPNTAGLRSLQEAGEMSRLLDRLCAVRAELAAASGLHRPILVKVAPDLDEQQIEAIAGVLRGSGVDGLIATNTTVTRPGLEDDPLAQQAGGLSGAPLRPLAESVLRRFRASLGPDYPIIGVGGIDGPQAAVERRKAGADLVQVYTGLIYEGPALVTAIGRAMLPADAVVR